MKVFRLLSVALLFASLVRCSPSAVEVPSIEGWTGEPQVAEKIEQARRRVIDEPSSARAMSHLGMIFQAHELHAEAVACYRRAAELAPEDGRWPYLAALSLRADDLEAALGLFEEARRRGMNHPAFHVNFADALARLGRSERAQQEYVQALEVDPSTTHALCGIAQLALARGETEVARERLERAREIAPWHGEVRRLLAQTYRRLGRTEDADRELEAAGNYPEATQAADPVFQAVKDEAVTAVAFKSRARKLAEGGRYQEAESFYRKVIEVRAATAGDYSDLGGALAGQGRTEEAIEYYRRAIELDDSDPYARNNLAMALAQKGDLEAAVRHLVKAIELEPRYPEAHHNLGLARARQRRFAEAVGHYRESLAIDPSFASAYNDLGTALASLGRLDEAIASWEKALEIDSRELTALHNLSVALGRTGRHAEALDWLARGLEIAPNSSRLSALLAWELATAPQPELRDGARAVAIARRVFEAYPDQPDMANILAAALAEAGDFDAAVQVAGEAVEQALAANQRALAAQIRKSLDGYRRGLPQRQPS